MAFSIFPSNLKGIGYPVIKRTRLNNIVQSAVSGIEVRIANWGAPLAEWDIPFSWLSAASGLADYQTLSNFYQSVFGQWGAFLYSDPTDNSATLASMGTGDGVTTTFQLTSASGFPIYDVNSIPGAPQIYLGGILQGSGYSIGATGLVTFSGAPGVGVTVAATFSYYYRVRFADDAQEFETFALQLWETKKISLRQLRAIG